MVKVLEEKEVPRAEAVCGNCGSLLEYGNADLSQEYDNSCMWTERHSYYFICPVCDCKVYASWIINKKV